jgi:chaperone modulatory protein CbpM
MSHAMVRVPASRFTLDEFAMAAGLHPDLVRRLVALGIVEAGYGPAGELRFSRDQLAVVARMQRLRAGLGLNYAAVALVTDLLDRIAVLETALRGSQWPGR